MYFENDHYTNIRQDCDDHIHFNSLYDVTLNDNSFYNESRIKELDKFEGYLRDLFTLHFVLLFLLEEHYMMSSDYSDSLDMEVASEEGSQYWVAPFVQEIFDTYIKPYRKDVADCLIDETDMDLK